MCRGELTDSRLAELSPVVQVVAVQVGEDGQVLSVVLIQSERLIVQLVSREIRCRIVKAVRTSSLQIPQSALSPAEVVVNPEPLLVRLQRTQLAEEREILLRVLRSATVRWRTCLLGVLRDHEHQLEVVHSQCDIVEPVDVGEEDHVLDGLLYDSRVVHCRELVASAKAYPAAAAGHSSPPRSLAAACRHGS